MKSLIIWASQGSWSWVLVQHLAGSDQHCSAAWLASSVPSPPAPPSTAVAFSSQHNQIPIPETPDQPHLQWWDHPSPACCQDWWWPGTDGGKINTRRPAAEIFHTPGQYLHVFYKTRPCRARASWHLPGNTVWVKKIWDCEGNWVDYGEPSELWHQTSS